MSKIPATVLNELYVPAETAKRKMLPYCDTAEIKDGYLVAIRRNMTYKITIRKFDGWDGEFVSRSLLQDTLYDLMFQS